MYQQKQLLTQVFIDPIGNQESQKCYEVEERDSRREHEAYVDAVDKLCVAEFKKELFP